MLWAITAGVAFGFFLTSIPAYYAAVQQVRFVGHGGAELSPLTSFFNVVGGLASLTSALISLGLATVLFIRRFDDRMARFTSFYLLGYGIIFSGPMESLDVLWPGWGALVVVVGQPLWMTMPTVGLFCLFPNGKYQPEWTRWLVRLSFLLIPLIIFLPPISLYGDQPWLTWIAIGFWGGISPSVGAPDFRFGIAVAFVS